MKFIVRVTARGFGVASSSHSEAVILEGPSNTKYIVPIHCSPIYSKFIAPRCSPWKALCVGYFPVNLSFYQKQNSPNKQTQIRRCCFTEKWYTERGDWKVKKKRYWLSKSGDLGFSLETHRWDEGGVSAKMFMNWWPGRGVMLLWN